MCGPNLLTRDLVLRQLIYVLPLRVRQPRKTCQDSELLCVYTSQAVYMSSALGK